MDDEGEVYRAERRWLRSSRPVLKFEVVISGFAVEDKVVGSRLRRKRSGVVRPDDDSRVSAVKVGEAMSKLPGMLLLGPKPG